MQFTQEDLIELGEFIAQAQRPGVKAALQDLVRSQHEVGESGETCASKQWRQHDLGAESICREEDMLCGHRAASAVDELRCLSAICGDSLVVSMLRQLPS